MKIHRLNKISSIILFCCVICFSGSVFASETNTNTTTHTDTATASDTDTATDTDTNSLYNYYLYVFYDPKDTIVIDKSIAFTGNGTRGDEANYPECAFVSLVFVEENKATGKKRLYTGPHQYTGPAHIKLVVKSKPPVPEDLHYQLFNIVYPGYYLDIEKALHDIDQNGNRVLNLEKLRNYKLFSMLSKENIPFLQRALRTINNTNGEDAPKIDLPNNINESRAELVSWNDAPKNTAVIAVKNWNYKKGISNLPLEIGFMKYDPNYTEIKEVTIIVNDEKGNTLSIKLSNDNIELSRVNLQDKNIYSLIPKPGDHYTGDPGLFIVKGGKNPATGEERTYSQILEILVDVAEGKIPPTSIFKGADKDWRCKDWLEVAAADIYNNPGINEKVFKCVWAIEGCYSDTGPFGYISPGVYPFLVSLNPYSEDIRFNQEASAYGFTSYKSRDGVIYHESLHVYQYLPGESVNDEEYKDKREGDELYVGKDGGKNPYFTFAYDHKKRGFLEPDNSKSNYIEALLHGLWGDDYVNKMLVGRFITRIDDKLTKDELKKVFLNGEGIEKLIPTDIPEDLPVDISFYIETKKKIDSIYLSHPNGKCLQLDSIELQLIRDETQPRIKSPYGYYEPCKWYFDINEGYSGSSPKPQKCLDLIDKHGYHLYAVYEITYLEKELPYEYDASYFDSISRGPRGD